MVALGRQTASGDLALLRVRVLAALDAFAGAVWPRSPILFAPPDGRTLDTAMLAVQAGVKGTLNSVWAEKARLIAKESVSEQWRRARRNLFGRLKHVATVGEKPMEDGVRRLVNLPEEWSRTLSDVDVAALAAFAEGLDFPAAMAAFAGVAAGSGPDGLTKLQAQALDAMRLLVEERFGRPRWDSDAVVQLHLDFRCFPGGREVMDALLAGLTGDAGDETSKSPPEHQFPVAGGVARGPAIPLGAKVVRRAVDRLVRVGGVRTEGRPSFTSLALEVGPESAEVKGVYSLKPDTYGAREAETVLGEDFGYANTVAWTLFRPVATLDPAFFEKARDWGREECLAYLSTHRFEGEVDVVERVLHCGKDFLARIDLHAGRIDRLKSEIDRMYNRIGRLKHEICRILGVGEKGFLVDFAMRTDDRMLARCVARMAKLLGAVKKLKALRVAAYAAIAGVKKSWFGWLGNRRVELALKHRAAVVSEALTIAAEPKEAPGYKGRTFNKMLNNGSVGQYTRAVDAKMTWFGIPFFKAPSWFTSSTDHRHAVVDKAQRRDATKTRPSVFRAHVDRFEQQADLHASETVGVYALMTPVPADERRDRKGKLLTEFEVAA